MDGTVTAGRKGLPYDWQALLAEHHADDSQHDRLHIEKVALGGRGRAGMVGAVA